MASKMWVYNANTGTWQPVGGHTEYADINHEHTEYALETHTHPSYTATSKTTISPVTGDWVDYGGQYGGLFVTRLDGSGTDGGIVVLEGLLKAAKAMTVGNGVSRQVATVPSGYRPQRQWIGMQLANGIAGRLIRLDVNTGGAVILVNNSNAVINIAAGAWITINLSYRTA